MKNYINTLIFFGKIEEMLVVFDSLSIIYNKNMFLKNKLCR